MKCFNHYWPFFIETRKKGHSVEHDMCDIHAVVFVTSHILLYVLMHDDIEMCIYIHILYQHLIKD